MFVWGILMYAQAHDHVIAFEPKKTKNEENGMGIIKARKEKVVERVRKY